MNLSEINERNRILDINIFLQIETSEIAADRIHHPSIRRQFKMTDSQLNAYEDFIDTVVSILESSGFTILDEYQSKKSYAYYITFEVPELLESWTIRFRIANHNQRTTETARGNNRPTIFRKITIGAGKEFASYMEAIRGIQYICNGLKTHDFDVLNIEYKDMDFQD